MYVVKERNDFIKVDFSRPEFGFHVSRFCCSFHAFVFPVEKYNRVALRSTYLLSGNKAPY